ncbi:hypothetical protein [Glaciibacter psychrotolerans]|uniref:Uncharacterized protein n=1 Tax=Glaciibacter psychrotolerans TaxID=670054 RepID=A0A7Z0EG81_9MICO|nr:hypothetical protein [Leifsonia psychrotolerans]NYJ21084.1 hypothetical protein [Leifsonia psychrotolerans]
MSTGGNAGRQSRWRAILGIVIIAVLLVVALGATIGSLNRDLYSAGGFVQQYLSAVARADTHGALSLPGVMPTAAELKKAGLPADLPTTLLRGSVLSPLDDIRLVSDTEREPGLHTVSFAFTLDKAPANMDFTVRSTGVFAGVFTSWRFETSPLGVLQVDVAHQSLFTVNGLTLDTRAHAAPDAPATFSNQASYLVFAPNLYEIKHDTALLTAPEQKVPVTSTAVTHVTVDAEPNASFISQVQAEVDKFLDACATQEVLQPSDCPFGIVIDDRIKGVPTWSIADYPPVTLAAGETDFEMPDTEGQAHIVVDVQSLYDGDLSTRDENVPFAIGLGVGIRPDGSIAIQLH